VPERDFSQVIKNMEDTREILATLKEELVREEGGGRWDRGGWEINMWEERGGEGGNG